MEASTAGRRSDSDDDSGHHCDQDRFVFWVDVLCLYSVISVIAVRHNSVECRMINECKDMEGRSSL